MTKARMRVRAISKGSSQATRNETTETDKCAAMVFRQLRGHVIERTRTQRTPDESTISASTGSVRTDNALTPFVMNRSKHEWNRQIRALVRSYVARRRDD